jgi:hypothetical protein
MLRCGEWQTVTEVSMERSAFNFRVKQFKKSSGSEDEGTNILQNNGNNLPVDTG